MVKMMFMLYRKTGVTHEQCVTEWMGAQHLSSLDEGKAGGLRRYIQNAVTGDEREGAPMALASCGSTMRRRWTAS